MQYLQQALAFRLAEFSDIIKTRAYCKYWTFTGSFSFYLFFIIIGAIDRDILNPPVIELLKFSMHITQQFLKDVNSLIEA